VTRYRFTGSVQFGDTCTRARPVHAADSAPMMSMPVMSTGTWTCVAVAWAWSWAQSGKAWTGNGGGVLMASRGVGFHSSAATMSANAASVSGSVNDLIRHRS